MNNSNEKLQQSKHKYLINMEKTKNRLRKYRAWTGERMMFRNLHDRNWYSEPFAGKICDVAMPDDIFYCKIMDFTGFYDFDNKEIYEDDILQYVSFRRKESKRLEIVQFDIKCGGWYVHKSADTLADVLFCQHNDEWKLKQGFSINENQRVRIIGNIFENPELIKE